MWLICRKAIVSNDLRSAVNDRSVMPCAARRHNPRPHNALGSSCKECGTHWASTVFGAMKQISQLSGL